MNCLELTLYPSLTLALLDGKRVKIFGVKKGVRAGEDVYISGRWYSPWKYINEADGNVRDKVQRLAERFGDCVGISISPGDEDLIFVASFLTQNTSYHTNVLRWTRAMFSKTEDLAEIAKIAPGVGRSYQLQRLPAAVEDYLTLGRPRERAALLRIRGVGPKVADLFLLFTGDTTSAPVDKHYMRIAPQAGPFGEAAGVRLLQEVYVRQMPAYTYLLEAPLIYQAGQTCRLGADPGVLVRQGRPPGGEFINATQQPPAWGGRGFCSNALGGKGQGRL